MRSPGTEPAPLLVVSGWGYPEEALRPLLTELGEAGATTSAADPDSVGDRLRSLAASSGRPVVVLGWSLGGMLALELAAKEPESVGALLLVSTTPRFCADGAPPSGVERQRVRALRLGLRKSPEETLQRFYVDVAAPHNPLWPGLDGFRDASPGVEALGLLRRGLDYLERVDLRASAAALQAPCRVVHGTEDRVVPFDAGEWLATEIPKARRLTAEGVGHDVPLRSPALLRRALEELREVAS